MATKLLAGVAIDITWLCGLIALVYWKLVFSVDYTILEAPDFANQVMPWLDLQARALREGQIALWNPYSLGGQPLAAQLQPGVTNPLVYLLLAAPLRNGHLNPYAVHGWLVILHLLSGVFTYLLARDRNLPRWAAIGGGLIFATGGYPGHTHWPQHLSGILWLPLIALFVQRAIDGVRREASAAAAGLFLGLAWLSGHPQVPLFATLAATVTLVAALRGSCWSALLRVAGIAALVSTAAWLPALEFGRQAVRWVDLPEPYTWTDHIPYYVHEKNALPAASLPNLLIPGEAQSLANPLVGGVAMSLAMLGLAAHWRRRETRWWGLAAVLSLGFALARGNPFHGVLYELVPMLEMARTPAAALAITQLAVAMLAAQGLAAALEEARQRWTAPVAIGLGLAAAAAFVLVLFEPAAITRIPEGANRVALAAFLWLMAGTAYWVRARGGCSGRSFALTLALLVVFEMSASIGFDYRRFDDDSKLSVWRRVASQTQALAGFLKQHGADRRAELRYEDVLFNFGDWHAIETLSGYQPAMLASQNALGGWEPRVLALYGVGYSIGKSHLHQGQKELVAEEQGGLKLYELAGAMPRAWSVHRAQQVPSAAEAARLIVAGSVDPGESALLTGGTAPTLERCAGLDEVRVVERRFNLLRLHARMACRGLVIVNDNHYPGWEARIDGRASPIVLVDAALRAVVVETGTHEIAFNFRPASVYRGMALSLIGFAAAAASIALGRAKGVA